MCEVCRAEGLDPKFRNGNRPTAVKNILYKVYRESVANIRLCHIHSIELFMLGEKRFLREHLQFARDLAKKSTRIDSRESSPFNF